MRGPDEGLGRVEAGRLGLKEVRRLRDSGASACGVGCGAACDGAGDAFVLAGECDTGAGPEVGRTGEEWAEAGVAAGAGAGAWAGTGADAGCCCCWLCSECWLGARGAAASAGGGGGCSSGEGGAGGGCGDGLDVKMSRAGS